MFAAVMVGTVTSNRQVYVGYTPAKSTSYLIFGAWVCAGKAVTPNPNNYWKLSLGKVTSAKFIPVWEISLKAGVSLAGTKFEPKAGVSAPRGSVLALKASAVGNPPPLENLSVVFEYGPLGPGV